MTKDEFEAVAKKTVSDTDYEVIEFVYARHPSIRPSEGKQDIANIYNLPGGMRIIHDMVQTAKEYERLTTQLFSLQNKFEEVRDQINALKNGREE